LLIALHYLSALHYKTAALVDNHLTTSSQSQHARVLSRLREY